MNVLAGSLFLVAGWLNLYVAAGDNGSDWNIIAAVVNFVAGTILFASPDD